MIPTLTPSLRCAYGVGKLRLPIHFENLGAGPAAMNAGERWTSLIEIGYTGQSLVMDVIGHFIGMAEVKAEARNMHLIVRS